jgi:hypothetical protein
MAIADEARAYEAEPVLSMTTAPTTQVRAKPKTITARSVRLHRLPIG